MAEKQQYVVSSKEHDEFMQRAVAQTERFQHRLNEQARLLGIQGKRIQEALRLLSASDPEVRTATETAVLRVLQGETDG